MCATNKKTAHTRRSFFEINFMLLKQGIPLFESLLIDFAVLRSTSIGFGTAATTKEEDIEEKLSKEKFSFYIYSVQTGRLSKGQHNGFSRLHYHSGESSHKGGGKRSS